MEDFNADAVLVSRALAGSDAAFSRLVERHQAAVRAFLRRLLGGGWAEADDVAQDRMRSSRRGAARDSAWLETSDPPAGVSPEDRMALAAAMADLPPEVRACVALCLADGWSHSEAAVALDLPLGTVKSHVNRGRARVLKALGGSDDA